MQRMLDEGVSTRRGVMNAHREPAYPAGSWRSAGPLVRGEQAQDTVIVLPLYHQMTDEEQERVASSLQQAGIAMISILTPAFNESANLEALHARLTQTMAQLGGGLGVADRR